MPSIDQTKIKAHNACQREQLAKAIALTTPASLAVDPVEFAMIHDGLPIWAVKEARRRVGAVCN
jgi:hypothetical protein